MKISHKRVHCALQWRCCQVGANALFNFSTQSHHQVVCVTVLQLKRSVRQGSRDTDRRQGDRVKIWIFSQNLKCFQKAKCFRKSEIFQKLSSKIVIEKCHQKLSSKIVIKNGPQKLSSKIVIENCHQKLSWSCLLITLIKCLNGSKSLGLLFVWQK